MTLRSELRTKGMRWHVLPGLKNGGIAGDLLFGLDGLRLKEWLASGEAGIVKYGPHRSVYRVVLPGLDFIVKWYPEAKTGGKLGRLLQSSPARRECELALAVTARNVATVEPMAVGEAPSGASCLLLRTLANAQPLDLFLEWTLPELSAEQQGRLRRQVAIGLGEFLAQMHDAGLLHRDLHPGNLLVDVNGAGPRFHLVDLHGVQLGTPLNWSESKSNLIVLNRWFMLRVNRPDRFRFWVAYRRTRQSPGWAAEIVASREPASPQRKLGVDLVTQHGVRELERGALASNLRFWQAQDRRCLEDNRYYRKACSTVAAGHVVADLDPEALRDLLENPDAAFERSNVRVLKSSRSSTVVEMDLAVNGRMRRVIYKRFLVTSWTDPLVALVRRTPALRSFVLGHGLRLRGLPTPRPLGVWHRYRAGLAHEGYLLTEKAPDAIDLVAFVGKLRDMPARQRSPILRRAIDLVARLVGDLHQRRLSQRDLKGSNILMSSAPWSLAQSEQERRRGAGPALESTLTGAALLQNVHPWFIDLVGVSRHTQVSRERRVQNLARLNASFLRQPILTHSDRLRFLRVYLRWGLRGRFGWKRWWREVAAATQTKVERNLRTGRVLG